MKKSFISFSLITLSLTFVLSLASCSNLFSKGSNDETESQTATFIGNINIDSLLGSDFVTNNSRSARPEPINIGTGYKYFVKAEDNNNLTYTSEDSESRIQLSGNTFEATLPYGTWTITVSIRENNSTDDILKDTLPEQILNAASPTFQYDFFLKPVTEGTGDFSLTMYVNKKAGITEEDSNYVNKLEVTMLYKPAGASLSDTEISLSADKTSFTYYRASSTETVKPGTYKILFTFKHGDTPVFSTLQAINIVRGLITNTWVGGTSTLINPDGTFELTEELIKAWRLRRTDYYVGGTGASDSNTGSHDDPLATIKHAVALVNDINYGDTEVKIHVADNLVEELETTGININTGKKILIDIQNGVTTAPVLKRTSSLSGALIKVNNGAELTINGININGNQIPSSANCGVYIYNGGTFTLKSGKITENWNSYTDGTGAGIYNAGVLNLYGGEISSNKVTGDNGVGGGVYSQGTINLKGAVTIKDNGSTNLYLASGKKINISGTLTQGTNKSDIYVSSETVPSKNTPVVFTNNYGYNNGYNNAIDPDKYFTGDKFVVTFLDASDENNPGEAVFKTNDATIKHVLSDMNITFKLSKKKFIPGTASEITITPKITIKETIQGTSEIIDYTENALADTDSPLTWNVKMYLGSKVITDCTFNSETKTLTIPATVTSTETFTLFVSATYRGMTFSEEFVLNQYNPGMINVQGTTWGSDSTPLSPASSVFISNREFTIPSLIVSEHEVTQEEYERYCNYGSTAPSDTYGKGANYPAYFVSWYDALIYCNLRSWAEGLTPVYSFPTNTQWHPQYWSGRNESSGKYCGPSTEDADWNNIVCHWDANGWRLPTEAEWEYLARTGNTESYTYSGSNNIDDVAWYNNNSDNKTHEVKTKNPNGLELYDMSGNVWEWCWDPFSATLTEAPLSGPENGNINRRTNRGGSFDYADERCTVENRNEHGDLPSTRHQCLGFRIVRNAD